MGREEQDGNRTMRKGGGRRKRGRMKMKEVMKGGKGWEGARRVEHRQVNPKEGFRGDLKILRSTHLWSWGVLPHSKTATHIQTARFHAAENSPSLKCKILDEFSFVLTKAKSSR
jgi:hypothetical protein